MAVSSAGDRHDIEGMIEMMNGEKLQQTAAEEALALAGAEVSEPFGPDYEVYKVHGKVFMMTTEVPGREIVTLKSDPADAAALCQTYRSITPGYHMNKRHWISISAGEGVTRQLVEELVGDSYALVVQKLPKAAQARLRARMPQSPRPNPKGAQ